MNILESLLFIVVIVYIANILGCLVLCETIPNMNFMRKYAWYIPIVNISFIIHVVFNSSIKNRVKYLWRFIRLPHKNIVAIKIVAHTLEEKVTTQQCSYQSHSNAQKIEQRAGMLRDNIKNYGIVFSMGQP